MKAALTHASAPIWYQTTHDPMYDGCVLLYVIARTAFPQIRKDQATDWDSAPSICAFSTTGTMASIQGDASNAPLVTGPFPSVPVAESYVCHGGSPVQSGATAHLTQT